jgi:hypothetical protein
MMPDRTSIGLHGADLDVPLDIGQHGNHCHRGRSDQQSFYKTVHNLSPCSERRIAERISPRVVDALGGTLLRREDLAEREGFEPSVELYGPTTV